MKLLGHVLTLALAVCCCCCFDINYGDNHISLKQDEETRVKTGIAVITEEHTLSIKFCRQIIPPTTATLVWCFPASDPGLQMNRETVERCGVGKCMVTFNISQDSTDRYYTVVANGNPDQDTLVRDVCFNVAIKHYGYDVEGEAFFGCNSKIDNDFKVEIKAIDGNLSAIDTINAKMQRPTSGIYNVIHPSTDNYIAAIFGAVFGAVVVVMGIFYYQMEEEDPKTGLKTSKSLVKYVKKRK